MPEPFKYKSPYLINEIKWQIQSEDEHKLYWRVIDSDEDKLIEYSWWLDAKEKENPAIAKVRMHQLFKKAIVFKMQTLRDNREETYVSASTGSSMSPVQYWQMLWINNMLTRAMINDNRWIGGGRKDLF